MNRDSKNVIVIAGLTLMLAAGWLAYGVRYDALDAYREWRRGPIPEAVSRIEFDRAVSRVPSAKAEKQAEPESASTDTESNQEPETGNGPELAEETSRNETEPAESNEEAEEPTQETEPEPEEPKDEPDFAPALNLRMAFMVQAPQQNWDEMHGEACEEASSIMLASYYQDEAEITVEEAESRLMNAITYEAETFGYHLDTTSKETARMLREHFEVTGAQAIEIDSIDEIKASLNAGHPVIVPAYGKALGNPNFRNGGPLYHMLVVKGYTDTHFITNDPGTRRGADYVYDFETLWNAIHDWNDGDVPNGKKMMIAVR